MPDLKHLFERNRIWSEGIRAQDPGFFGRLSRLQAPEYLWIGCSDSRVPANQITGLDPGEVFVHRNVANVVVHSDLNCLSVVQYAVDVLHVKHILVVGHYGCAGVKATLQAQRLGLVDNWLRHIQDIQKKHEHCIANCRNFDEQVDTLCKLNVIEQVFNLCRTTVLCDAWDRGQGTTVHGWVYGLSDGLAHDLSVSVSQPGELLPIYEAAIERIYTGLRTRDAADKTPAP